MSAKECGEVQVIDNRIPDEPRYYDKKVYCLNCGFKGTLRQSKGVHSYHIYADCPNCECSTLEFS